MVLHFVFRFLMLFFHIPAISFWVIIFHYWSIFICLDDSFYLFNFIFNKNNNRKEKIKYVNDADIGNNIILYIEEIE